MTESVKTWAPLDWGGALPEQRMLLDRVSIENTGGDLLVSDASTGRELLRLDAGQLRQRSLVGTLLNRLGDFYCTGCGALLGDGVLCTDCGIDRAQRLRDTIAMLEEEV